MHSVNFCTNIMNTVFRVQLQYMYIQCSFYSTRLYVSIKLKRCQFKPDWKLIYGFILIYD